MRPIFISSVGLRLPHLPDDDSLAHDSQKFFRDIRTALSAASETCPGTLITIPGSSQKMGLQADDPPSSHPHYPHTRDIKSMATDVVSACLAFGRMIERAGLTRQAMQTVPLHVAKGVCNAGAVAEITEFVEGYFQSEVGKSVSERNTLLFGRTYPLIVLKVLSNSLQSFLSQIYGPAGDSTTFGNTSIGGFHALAEGAEMIARGEAEIAIVGATQASDFLSAATYLNFQKKRADYQESHAEGFLVLRSEKNIRETGAQVLCELVDFRAKPQVPVDFSQALPAPYADWLFELPMPPAGSVSIFSGGVFADIYENEKAVLSARKTLLKSWFPRLGNLGAASVLANVVGGAALFTDENLQTVECFDRDPYGRESWVRLGRIKAGAFS